MTAGGIAIGRVEAGFESIWKSIWEKGSSNQMKCRNRTGPCGE